MVFLVFPLSLEIHTDQEKPSMYYWRDPPVDQYRMENSIPEKNNVLLSYVTSQPHFCNNGNRSMFLRKVHAKISRQFPRFWGKRVLSTGNKLYIKISVLIFLFFIWGDYVLGGLRPFTGTTYSLLWSCCSGVRRFESRPWQYSRKSCSSNQATGKVFSTKYAIYSKFI